LKKIYTAFKNQVDNNWKDTDPKFTPALDVWLNNERWDDAVIKPTVQTVTQKKQFRLLPSGMYKGFCAKCADKMFLKADEFYKSSPCCGVEFVPEQPKVYKGKDYTEETLNQIMGG
jgi:hypothetical protein